jgi:hypothetical protein
MRIFIALAGLALLTACRVVTEPLYGDGGNCQPGWSRSGGTCVQIYLPPLITVITIGPSRVYSDSADTMCYQVSPAPASIKAGESYRFQNNTGQSITIVDSNQIPWVTVGGYGTSSALSSSSAGVYGYGIQGCRGVGGTPWYGVLDVTIN